MSCSGPGCGVQGIEQGLGISLMELWKGLGWKGQEDQPVLPWAGTL